MLPLDTRMARLLGTAEELAQMGSWEHDLSSGETRWSAGIYRILGLPPSDEALRAEEIFSHVHPADRDRIRRMLANVAEAPGTVPESGLVHTVRMVRSDGSVRELRAIGRLEPDASGRLARWVGALQDVTDQRLTERELRAHHAVSQALLEWESFELGVVDLLCRMATALDYPMAALWLRERGTGALVCRAFWSARGVDPGAFEPVIRGLRLGEGEGKPGIAWQTSEPVVTPDVATDPVFVPREAALERGVASALAFPAVGPHGSLAVLSLYAFEPRLMSDELVRTLTAIGRELGRFLSRRWAEIGPRPLSEREIEVLRLAAEGVSGPGIAERLVLSPATVKTHFEHIYEKLGVGDRTAAVAQAMRTGVIH
jgi:PAS domain S-box-containing protein